AFVPCPETDSNPAYVRRLLAADPGDTVLTDTMSGRPARLLRNKLVDVLEDNSAHRLPFPQQLSMTRELRKAGARARDAEYLAMWAGQGVGLSRALPAADLVRALVSETYGALLEASGGVPDGSVGGYDGSPTERTCAGSGT
ncbi:MAG TPA: nitronate monooxygenase, partial [Hyphomicrobiaceae bacterium]|nr:nitronate monooxygenase [Hyphomicrobiaceae bacterium]